MSLHESSGLSDSELIQRFSPEDPALGGRPTDDPALDGVRPTDDPSLGLGPLREMLEFGGCIFIYLPQLHFFFWFLQSWFGCRDSRQFNSAVVHIPKCVTLIIKINANTHYNQACITLLLYQ